MCTRAISKYIRRTKRIYYGDRELKKRFIEDLQDSLLCFSEEHPDCSYKDLVDKFGSPYEIKESFLGVFPKELKKRDIILYRFVIICSVIIMVSIIIYTIHHVMNNYKYSQGYDIQTITDEELPEPTPKSESEQTPIVEYTFD